MTRRIYCDRHRADQMTSCPRCAEEKVVELEIRCENAEAGGALVREINHTQEREKLIAELKAAEDFLIRTTSRQRELLGEVANSAVEFDDERVRYVTIQIDRDTWDALQLWFAK